MNNLQVMHRDYITKKMDSRVRKLNLVHWRWVSLSPNVRCVQKLLHFRKKP